MTEEKTISKPKQLWNNALKAVKGDDTHQLVEEFTAEMTLVAEGLCEDQARLRKAVDALAAENDRTRQKLESELEAIETTVRENQRDLDKKLNALEARLTAVENRLKDKKGDKKPHHAGLIRQLTVLVSIAAGAWVLVTILNLFK